MPCRKHLYFRNLRRNDQQIRMRVVLVQLRRDPVTDRASNNMFGALVLGCSLFMVLRSMIDSVSKPKLSRGRSYVLKTSQLAKVLSDARIDCHVDLVYWLPQCGRSILEAQYWLPNENVPYSRVYVRAGVVPTALRSAARDSLTKLALPQFVEWLREILALPDESPVLQMTPYFNVAYTEKGLVITNQPKYKVRRSPR